jgi:predicted DNA-binding ArsR family transcriptional regulator
VGLEDVSRYPYLLAELARTKGWTMNQLEKLAGRNFLRVFRKVEKVKVVENSWILKASTYIYSLLSIEYNCQMISINGLSASFFLWWT